jgi:hypothetical protein
MIQSDNKLHNQFKLKSNITLMKFNNNWTVEVNSKIRYRYMNEFKYNSETQN